MSATYLTTSPQLIKGSRAAQQAAALPLYDTAMTRQIEHAAQAMLTPHALMQRAGLSTARLALALAPNANTFWIACGPGNNGGDGLEAAMHLKLWGKSPVVTLCSRLDRAPPDAAMSYQRARDAGVTFVDAPREEFDFCIDALLGIGNSSTSPPREIEGQMAGWIALINASRAPVLAVDVPTGLDADTGDARALCVRASATLSLVTLKPGLFTAHGRDASGDIWVDTLGAQYDAVHAPAARLAGAPGALARTHASHKGSFGDVLVIGGAAGMTGAALLAATASLHSGAGRVFAMLLDGNSIAVDMQHPELMFRPFDAPHLSEQLNTEFSHMTVVCGCGGGAAVRSPLAAILASNANAVLDADALNAIAADSALHALLSARAARGLQTVLTPHPLEAARLLATETQTIQQNRLKAAKTLAQRFSCIVVLKGSGTVIAAPGQTPVINPTGNALLATAGTGDVLAGMVGARLGALQSRHLDTVTNRAAAAFQATCEAVYVHGLVADDWPAQVALTASRLAHAVHAV